MATSEDWIQMNIQGYGLAFLQCVSPNLRFRIFRWLDIKPQKDDFIHRINSKSWGFLPRVGQFSKNWLPRVSSASWCLSQPQEQGALLSYTQNGSGKKRRNIYPPMKINLAYSFMFSHPLPKVSFWDLSFWLSPGSDRELGPQPTHVPRSQP